MNLAIARAMLREQFQRTLPIVIFCLGFGTLLALLQYVILAWEGRVSTADGSLEMVIVTHGFGILALLYCHSDERDLKMTMPTYLLRLPVRTIDLVVWRMSYGLLCVGVIGIWSSGVHYLFFGAAVEAEFAFWTPFLIGTTTFAVIQALAWSVGGDGIIVVFLANPVVLLLAVWLGFEVPCDQFDPSRYTAGPVLSILAVSVLVAYAGVRIRRSGFDISRKLGALSSMFARDRGVDRPPFASPEEAMRWFEWRRQGRMLPVLVLGGSLFLGSVALTLLDRANVGQSPESTMLVAYSGLVATAFSNALGIAAALFGAYCFFQNQRLQTGPQKTFLFVRPVSTKTLATARVVVVLRSVVVSMAPLVLACAVAVLLAARSEDPAGLPAVVENYMAHRLLGGHAVTLGGIGVAVLLLFGMLAAVWCLQWVGNVAAFVALLGIGSACLWVVCGFDYTRLEPFWPPILGIGTLMLFAGCAYLFYMAHQRDLVERSGLLMALAALPLLAVGFSTLMGWESFVNGGPFFGVPMDSGLLAFAVLPLAPLATVPLFMHFARHR